MKKEFKCKQCGKTYYSYKENSNFCSTNCKKEYSDSIIYTCDYCGATFRVTESKLKELKNGIHKHLFCSRDCANKFNYKSATKICEECGKKYVICNAFKDIQKYCSRKCYDKHRSKKIKILYKTCPVCKQEFETYHHSQTYCSRKCASIINQKRLSCTCNYCGKEFNRIVSEVEKNKRHYCSKECKLADISWNKEDIDNLRKYYGKVSKEELTDIISNKWDYDAIKRKAQWLGLTQSREWSDEETDILIKLYPTVPMNLVIESLPNRTFPSILGKAKNLGLISYFYSHKIYSNYEDDYLRENFLNKSNEELALSLKRTPCGIAQRLYKLDLHRPTEKHNYGDLNNYTRSRLSIWKQQYRESCNHTCAITGVKSNIIVHHIRSFNLLMGETIEYLDFPIYEDLDDYTHEELDCFISTFLSIQEYYGEYICITKPIHKQFHSLYGYGDNTKEQWDDFLSKYYNIQKAS